MGTLPHWCVFLLVLEECFFELCLPQQSCETITVVVSLSRNNWFSSESHCFGLRLVVVVSILAGILFARCSKHLSGADTKSLASLATRGSLEVVSKNFAATNCEADALCSGSTVLCPLSERTSGEGSQARSV